MPVMLEQFELKFRIKVPLENAQVKFEVTGQNFYDRVMPHKLRKFYIILSVNSLSYMDIKI